MSLFKRTLGFFAVMAVLPAVWAVTARPTVINTTSARMPTLTTVISGGTSSGTTTTTTQKDNECIVAYEECLSGADVCGSDFGECLTRDLFHSKKAQCASTLMTCGANAKNRLYGVAADASFMNKNTNDEFLYPTDGSILGQRIVGARLANRLDTSNCVRRYTTCLKRDDVCGADFELCTSDSEFGKQKLFCESTLARCEDAGVRELFGQSDSTKSPIAPGRLVDMIGASYNLAAVNAVFTCYKVADQCILNTCAKNPYKCKEGANKAIAKNAADIDEAESGKAIATDSTNEYTFETISASDIASFLKNSCGDTIGGNKFCYSASSVGDGVLPTPSQLQDEDNRRNVYTDISFSRWNDSMKSKIDDLIEKFDAKTKQRCGDTLTQCAMANCGGGSGLACYNIAASGTPSNTSVDITLARLGIKSACSVVVNNDLYCKYSAAISLYDSALVPDEDNDIFDYLFPANKDESDPIGVVASLNQKLATSFSQSAMVDMRKRCQTVAKNCVQNVCGADFAGCYRARTDFMSTITGNATIGGGTLSTTINTSYANSMNKVNGVLDRTIIVGLCMDSVKNNSTCEELIKAEAFVAENDAITNGGAQWGGASSVRDGWLGAGKTGVSGTNVGQYQQTDMDGNALCGVAADANSACRGRTGVCDTSVNVTDTITCDFSEPSMITQYEYSTDLASKQIFQDVVNDLEILAQAQYNAKLTKQQSMCLSGNVGGIVAANTVNGGVFNWVKLKSNRVPTQYTVSGLRDNQFVASNDLYGSFCAIRITLQSDDKEIQDKISAGKTWSTSYFAAGDAFTCGSWIPNADLEAIANDVAHAKTGTNTDGKMSGAQNWGAAGLGILGAIGGGFGGAAIEKVIKKNSLGGLNKNTKTNATYANACETGANAFINSSSPNYDNATQALSAAQQLGVSNNVLTTARNALDVANNASDENKASALQVAKEKMTDVKNACSSVDDADGVPAEKDKGNWIGAGVGATVGGLALGIGSAQIMKTSNRAKFNAAQQEWMDNVGSHIRCYIGDEEVGEYGDIISTTME